MTEPAENQTARGARKGADRRVKLAFLAVTIAIAVIVYFYHRQGKALLKSWPTDLAAALQRAKTQDQGLLVLFMASPPGQMTTRLARTTLRKPHNVKAITDGRFVRVKVALPTSLDSETARRYCIRELPTMLVLDPNGAELNRREGMIGEVPFRNGFLDCTQVVRPEAASTGPGR